MPLYRRGTLRKARLGLRAIGTFGSSDVVSPELLLQRLSVSPPSVFTVGTLPAQVLS